MREEEEEGRREREGGGERKRGLETNYHKLLLKLECILFLSLGATPLDLSCHC